MNLLDSTEETSGDVLFVNFNQDCTSLSVGSKKGFRVYSFPKVDELKVIHESAHEDVRIVERLFSSSLVAMVSLSAPRKLKVCHFKKGTEICNYSYSNTILAVKLNRQRLVVCLEESLYIHNIKDMKVLHTIRDTPPNPKGLCVLSPDLSLLAYPGSATIGEVQVFDALNLQAKSMIPAHDNPLAAMAFDPTGTKLATASEKGTVIRVFNVLDGTKLYEFRRGVKRCARIYSLSFSEDSTFLGASSNTETVHIFRLDDIKDAPKESCGEGGGEQGWLGYLGKALLQSASYLPAQVADMLCQGRAFATLHLPSTGKRNLCAIAKIEGALRVLVVSGEGVVYVHDLEPLEGGECPLLHTHTLLEGSGGVPSGNCCPADNNDLPPVPDSPRRTFQPGGASYASIVRGESGALAQDPTADESPKNTSPQKNYESDFPLMTLEG